MKTRNREQTIRAKLAEIAQKQQEALAEFQTLITKPDTAPAAIEQAQGKLTRLAAEQTRLLEELKLLQLQTPERFGAQHSPAGQRPMREQVLDLLDDLGVPSAPRSISEFAQACYGLTIDPSRFASLRRDEERAFRKDSSSRPAWVAPALNLTGFTPIPRLVTSSVWELSRRLIGPRTLRVNHLKTLLAILARYEHIKEVGDLRAKNELGMMLLGYARSVPGATIPGLGLEPSRVREATLSELSLIERQDRQEREEGAERLKKFPQDRQVWGLPAVLEGASQKKKKGSA